MDVAAAVMSHGGIARTRELRSDGVAPRALAAAVHARQIERVRVGWFAHPALPPQIKQAHAIGGRPACATVAQLHDLWMLGDAGLHVELDHTQSRLRGADRAGVHLHWSERPTGSDRRGQPLVEALIQMATCTSRLAAICAIDSALNRRVVSFGDLARAAGPRSAAADVLDWCDRSAESGVESIFRVRARRAGYVFRAQATTSGGRADFAFGDRLLVEVDGSQFHSGHEQFTADRERDAWHAAAGYFVVRLTYAQVVHRWHEVESLLQLLHARGEHLGRSRIRSPRRHAAPRAT